VTRFAVRIEVLRALMDSPEWVRRVKGCRTTAEAQECMAEFAESRGWKVEELGMVPA
jgi:hypothetical protein